MAEMREPTRVRRGAEEKADIRTRMLERRRGLSPACRERAALLAQDALLASAEWKEARTVLLYCAVRGELDTARLLDAAWTQNKHVLLPRCVDKGVMEAVGCPGRSSLCAGRYGIPEPATGLAPFTDAPDLVVLPAVALDRRGVRLGYGGGYYDRYCAGLLPTPASDADASRPFLMGFVYAFQVVDALPAETWDCRVRAICTENGLLRV